MGIHSSINLSRRQAAQIVASAMGSDEDLKDLASYVLEKYTTYNVYRLDDAENDDERAANALQAGRAVGAWK